MKFQLKEALNFAAIDETEGVIFDPVTMSTFSLNETGLWLFRQAEAADGALDTETLSAVMAEEYDVPVERAMQDVTLFCETLCDRGLAAPPRRTDDS